MSASFLGMGTECRSGGRFCYPSRLAESRCSLSPTKKCSPCLPLASALSLKTKRFLLSQGEEEPPDRKAGIS